MNKFQCLKLLEYQGDSIVGLKGEEDICATTDFSNKYIRRQRFKRYKLEKDKILVFSWTDWKFKMLEVKNIRNIKPLSEILGNKPNELRTNQ